MSSICPDLKILNNGDTSLIAASRNGQVTIVQQLLGEGVDVNEKNRYSDTALMEASRFGHLEVVQILAGITDINVQNTSGDTALTVACMNGRQSIADELLTRNPDVNLCNCTGITAFLFACSNGNVQIMEKLFISGASLTSNERSGSTPLMCAVSSDNLKAVEFLLDKGLDINAKDRKGNSALILAATSQEPKLDMIKVLINHGADVNVRNHTNRSLLSLVVAKADLQIVQYLINECGVCVDEPDDEGKTPLMYATSALQIDSVKYLIHKGANVNHADNEEITAIDKLEFLLPRKSGERFSLKMQMALTLIQSGATLSSGELLTFVLHGAIRKDDHTMVKLMLQRGMGPELISAYLTQQSPLLIALLSGRLKIAQYFISQWFFSLFDVTFHRYIKLYRKRLSAKCGALMDELYCQPWSLTCLSFVTVSDAVGYNRGREDRIRTLRLPRLMVQKLLFYEKDTTNVSELK